jgi:hypothetical protein
MASDNFNRAPANPLDGSWATSSAWNALQLVSNAVQIVTASSDSAMVSTASTATDSQVTLSVVNASTTIAGPAIHMSTSAGDGYALLYNAGFWHVYVLPSFSDIGSWFASPSLANGDVARLRRGPGNTLIININTVDVFTTLADTTYLGGAPGMFIYDGTTVFDDWTDNAAAGDTFFGQACL